MIAPQLMESEEFVERFRREAEAAGRLRHPNVVNVTDFGFTSSGSMNLCISGDGVPRRRLARGDVEGTGPPSAPGVVIDIVEQICLAVNMAHVERHDTQRLEAG